MTTYTATTIAGRASGFSGMERAMGTRADFYVGKGKSARWIGSIAWDGYRDGIPDDVKQAETSRQFRAAVRRFFKDRDDVTLPDMGWPWPWECSDTTDCSYWFFDGQVWDAHRDYDNDSGDFYVPCSRNEPQTDSERARKRFFRGCEKIDYPDMTARKNVAMGNRSGLIVITA